MRVLFFGTYDARRHPRVLVLQEGLAELGDEVLECNVTLGIGTSTRVRMLRHPWLVPLIAIRLVTTWTRLWRQAKDLPPVDAVVVGYLGQFDVHLARRRWKKVPIALDHLTSAVETAVDRGRSKGTLLATLDRIDRSALRTADLVCVDTEEHLQTLPDEVRRRGLVVPVGASSAWFSPRPTAEAPSLDVIFFGLYTPVQGPVVIGDAIRLLSERAGIRFTMVGRGQDYTATRRAAEGGAPTTWLDWVEAEELPSLVARHQVCLGIFGNGAKGTRVVPNKVFQGAAAGCAVVTSDTAPQRRALGDAAVFVPPGDPNALAEVLRALAASPARVQALRQAAAHRAEECFRPAVVVAALRDRLRTEVVSR
jgi:glycosyltransferase involved in cell wall biosynthesis